MFTWLSMRTAATPFFNSIMTRILLHAMLVQISRGMLLPFNNSTTSAPLFSSRVPLPEQAFWAWLYTLSSGRIYYQIHPCQHQSSRQSQLRTALWLADWQRYRSVCWPFLSQLQLYLCKHKRISLLTSPSETFFEDVTEVTCCSERSIMSN